MVDRTEMPYLSEAQFAGFVDALASDPLQQESLLDLLQENHPFYDQRSAAAIVRMRGWVLLALERTGVSERALPFVLEEFAVVTDAYLVAAAARALRSYERPNAELTPLVIHALSNVQDEPLLFENYGEYASSSNGTTAVRELLLVLVWLGPNARSALPVLASMRAQPSKFPKKLLAELDRTVTAIHTGEQVDEDPTDACCMLLGRFGQKSWSWGERGGAESADSIVFEDQNGEVVRFREIFERKPSIVVFFYTRCDNPWKCSLTITKMARVQQLLIERGLSGRIQTAAITYDPSFDLPKRLHGYGRDRGVSFDTDHRMLRTTEGFAALRNHFHLGVNFIESLVNRHRIELYVLDRTGRIAASFERVHWNESQVVDRASELLREDPSPAVATRASFEQQRVATALFGPVVSLAWAIFPKCPMCWSAYLSALGMAGMAPILNSSKVQPIFLVLILLNIISVWFRTRATHQRIGYYLVCAGTLALILSRTMAGWDRLALVGAALTILGSLRSVSNRRPLETPLRQIWTQFRKRMFFAGPVGAKPYYVEGCGIVRPKA